MQPNTNAAADNNSIPETVDNVTQEVRERVGSAVDNVIDKARQVVADVPGAVSNLAEETVDRIGKASDYVRDIDPKATWNNIQQFVKSRPTESLMVALALGFIAGRLGVRRM